MLTTERKVEAVVVGASSGGVEALDVLLPRLPALVIPVIVVVHLPRNHESLLVELFRPRCASSVREATDKESVDPGVWFAPADYHLLVERERTFALSVDEPVRFSRPSIDVLFESAADAWGATLACVVLTGANEDGAAGAAAVRRAGGLVMVQDPETAQSVTMPQAAIAASSPQVVAGVGEIAQLVASFAKGAERGVS